MERESKLSRFLTKAEEAFLILSIVAMGLIMTAQVLSRQIFGKSIVWSEELSIHIFIWSVFIGISYGINKDTHVKLDYFTLKLPYSLRKIVAHVVNVILILSLIYLMPFSLEYVQDQMKINSASMGYPMGFIMLAMTVSIVLTVIRCVQSSFVIFKSKEEVQ